MGFMNLWVGVRSVNKTVNHNTVGVTVITYLPSYKAPKKIWYVTF